MCQHLLALLCQHLLALLLVEYTLDATTYARLKRHVLVGLHAARSSPLLCDLARIITTLRLGSFISCCLLLQPLSWPLLLVVMQPGWRRRCRCQWWRRWRGNNPRYMWMELHQMSRWWLGRLCRCQWSRFALTPWCFREPRWASNLQHIKLHTMQSTELTSTSCLLNMQLTSCCNSQW